MFHFRAVCQMTGLITDTLFSLSLSPPPLPRAETDESLWNIPLTVVWNFQSGNYFSFLEEIASGTYDLLRSISSFGNYRRISVECFELIMM
jgi:hypothetical protein